MSEPVLTCRQVHHDPWALLRAHHIERYHHEKLPQITRAAALQSHPHKPPGGRTVWGTCHGVRRKRPEEGERGRVARQRAAAAELRRAGVAAAAKRQAAALRWVHCLRHSHRRHPLAASHGVPGGQPCWRHSRRGLRDATARRGSCYGRGRGRGCHRAAERQREGVRLCASKELA